MKSRILHGSYVIGFTDGDYPRDEINHAIQPLVDTHLKNAKNTESLSDWTLEFSIIYNNIDHLVLARKSRSYPNEKYKTVVMHIPIPSQDIVDWGVRKDQLLPKRWGYKNSKYVDIINVTPDNYQDRVSYIIDTLRLAINEIFKLGVTVNGKRVIVK